LITSFGIIEFLVRQLITTARASFAGVAQLVEQLICNQPVASSSLVTSFLINSMVSQSPQGLKALWGLVFERPPKKPLGVVGRF
jgi:hypothetical protein